MPAVGTQLTATAYNADPFGNDQEPHVFVFSDGWKMAISRRNGDANSSYWVFNPGSSTWSYGASLGYPVTSYDYHVTAQVGDTVYLFWCSGVALAELQLPWVSHALGATTYNVVNINTYMTSVPAYTTVSSFDVWWCSTTSRWYVAIIGAMATSNTLSILIFTNGLGYVATSNPGPTGPPYVSVRIVAASQATTTAYLAANTGGSAGSSTVWPLTLGASSVSFGTIEYCLFATWQAFDLVFDGSGNLDIIFVDTYTAPYAIRTVKRTGTNTYSAVVTLWASAGLSLYAKPTTVFNTVSGDLWVYFHDTANQANGEIIVVKRVSGIWIAGQVVAGGDAGGYRYPCAAANINSGYADLLYAYGTTTTPAMYAALLANTSVPNTPVTGAPAGNVAGLTPAFAFTYSNPAPLDLQYAYQIIVQRVSDNVVFWDSGQILSAANSGIVYGSVGGAPTTLVYGTQYTWKARTWDNGLHSPSSYSAGQTFTPIAAGVVTLNSLVDGTGVTRHNTDTIAAPGVTPYVTWNQASGNAANQYRIDWYDAPGGNLLDTTGWQTMTDLPATASVNLPTFTTTKLLNNSSGYYWLEIFMIDKITGVASPDLGYTAGFYLKTAWAIPAAPTSLAVAMDATKGIATLTWTNGAGAVSNRVYYEATGGGTNFLIHSGDLRTTIAILPAYGAAYDYGVSCVSAVGIESSITWATNNTMGLRMGTYGIMLSDSTKPSTVFAALGIGDTYQDMSQRDHVEDELSVLPVGRPRPISSFGPANAWYWPTQKFLVPINDSAGADSVTASAVINNLEKMGGASGAPVPGLTQPPTSHNTLVLRDFTGLYAFVVLLKLHEEQEVLGHRVVSFDLREEDTAYPGGWLAI